MWPGVKVQSIRLSSRKLHIGGHFKPCAEKLAIALDSTLVGRSNTILYAKATQNPEQVLMSSSASTRFEMVSNTRNADVLAMNLELVQKVVAPVAGNLDGIMQTGKGVICTKQQSPPNDRLNLQKPETELISGVLVN